MPQSRPTQPTGRKLPKYTASGNGSGVGSRRGSSRPAATNQGGTATSVVAPSAIAAAPGFSYTPPRYGGMNQSDLYSSRDISFDREPSTPNQFIPLGAIPQNQYWQGNAIAWELHLNGYEGGLGRVRGALSTVMAHVRGESSGAPLETRYVDSLGLPLVLRKSASPALSGITPSAPTVRATSAASGTSTSAAGTAPTGLATDDTMIAWVIHDDSTTTISAVPSGWTLLESARRNTSDLAAAMYYKVTTAADVSAGTWTWTLSGSERWRVIIAAVESGDTAGPVTSSTSEYVGSTTRFYLPSSGSAPISPSYDAGWEWTASAARLPMYADAQATPSTNVYAQFLFNGSSVDWLLRQYVSPPLAAQTISAQTVKLQMQGFESGSDANQFLTWSVKVVTPAGALRGQVLAVRRDGTEFATTSTNRSDSATSTSVDVTAGDYLVLEVGVGGTAAAENRTAAILIGDDQSSDLPENDTATALGNPWIGFANAVTFQAGAASDTIEQTTQRSNSLMFSLAAVDENSRTFTGTTDSGGTITEQIDSAAATMSLALYSEPVASISTVTHTITRSAGTTDMVTFGVVIQPALTGSRMSHATLFGTHAIARGQNLVIESNDLTPALSLTSYSASSPINALVPVIVGGATAPQRVAVLRTGDPIALLDDLGANPTVNGTAMHADTEPAWGLIQTILVGTTAQPEKDIMIYSNGAIRLMSRTDAIGTAPTATLTSVPNGGGAVGPVWIPGQPVRTLWMLPYEDCGTNQAAVNGVPLKPVFINLFGNDAQDLEVPLVATPSVTGRSYTNAWMWQNTVILTDGPRLWQYDGTPRLMNWPGERSGLGSTGQLLIRGGWTKAGQMRILVERVALFGGTGNTLYWVEEYDENTRRFHQVSAVVDSGQLGTIVGADAVGTFPLSSVSEIQYWHDDTQWSAQYVSDLTRNPAYDINGITSGGAHLGFEEEAAATSAEMVLPGLPNVPSVVTEIVYAGSPELGGDDAEVSVLIADQSRTSMSFPTEGEGVSATFLASDRWEKNHRPFPDNVSAWDRLQYKVIGRRGTDAAKTPQCFPIIIRGISFLDGRVEAPRKVLGAEWLQRFS